MCIYVCIYTYIYIDIYVAHTRGFKCMRRHTCGDRNSDDQYVIIALEKSIDKLSTLET